MRYEATGAGRRPSTLPGQGVLLVARAAAEAAEVRRLWPVPPVPRRMQQRLACERARQLQPLRLRLTLLPAAITTAAARGSAGRRGRRLRHLNISSISTRQRLPQAATEEEEEETGGGAKAGERVMGSATTAT